MNADEDKMAVLADKKKKRSGAPRAALSLLPAANERMTGCNQYPESAHALNARTAIVAYLSSSFSSSSKKWVSPPERG